MLSDVGEGPLSRWLSALLVVIYIISAFASGGLYPGIKMVGFCVIPWCCVWFPDAMGSYINSSITRSSPAIMAWILGWVVLLLPLITFFLLWVGGAFKYPPLAS
jgi:hypothetical protein